MHSSRGKHVKHWRRVSRMARGMQRIFYERSLYKLNLLSLEQQRLGGDMTTLWKIHWGRRQHIAAIKELADKKEECNWSMLDMWARNWTSVSNFQRSKDQKQPHRGRSKGSQRKDGPWSLTEGITQLTWSLLPLWSHPGQTLLLSSGSCLSLLTHPHQISWSDLFPAKRSQ